MAKSLRKHLTDAADLVAIVGLTMEQTVAVMVSCSGLTIHLKPLALAKVSRQLKIPRSKVLVDEDDENKAIHISFSARGAIWLAVIWRKDVPEFYAAMGAEPVKRLAAEPLKLVPPGPRRLELFSAEMEADHG